MNGALIGDDAFEESLRYAAQHGLYRECLSLVRGHPLREKVRARGRRRCNRGRRGTDPRQSVHPPRPGGGHQAAWQLFADHLRDLRQHADAALGTLRDHGTFARFLPAEWRDGPVPSPPSSQPTSGASSGPMQSPSTSTPTTGARPSCSWRAPAQARTRCAPWRVGSRVCHEGRRGPPASRVHV